MADNGGNGAETGNILPVLTEKQSAEQKERPAHLFKPGQSGNPKGRPHKAEYLPDLIEEVLKWKTLPEMLEEVPKLYRKKLKNIGHVLAFAVVTGSIKADQNCLKLLSEIVVKRHLLTIQPDGPIEHLIRVVYDEGNNGTERTSS